jgi:hypothetical protein
VESPEPRSAPPFFVPTGFQLLRAALSEFESVDALRRLLADGKITAYVLLANGATQPLERSLWGSDFGARVLATGNVLCVMTLRQQVQATNTGTMPRAILLPAAQVAAVVAQRPPVAASASVNHWFQQEIATRAQPPRREDMLREAKQRWPRLSKRELLKVWNNLAPAMWRKPGPKTKIRRIAGPRIRRT